MSMVPFLAHLRKCDVCRAFPRTPCAVGYELFEKGAERLVRANDPTRARA